MIKNIVFALNGWGGVILIFVAGNFALWCLGLYRELWEYLSK